MLVHNPWKDYWLNIRYIKKIMINILEVQYIFITSIWTRFSNKKRKKRKNLSSIPHFISKRTFRGWSTTVLFGYKIKSWQKWIRKGESRLPVILQKKVATIFLKPILYAIWLIVAGTYTFPITTRRIPPLFRIVQAIGGNERFGNMGFPESQLSTDWHLKSFRSETFRQRLIQFTKQRKDFKKKKKKKLTAN